MKIIRTASGKKKIKMSKNEWKSMGRKAGWTDNDSTEDKNSVTIWEFIEDWEGEGYGIALISPDGKVVDPYIDPSDYPHMTLNRSSNGAEVINGKYQDYYIIFHSGQLEDKIGEEYFCPNIGKHPQASWTGYI